VENNPVNFRDPTGKDIYGVSVGGGAAKVLNNIPGLVFPVPAAGGVSVTVAVDSNWDWNVVVTPEVGLGTPGVSGFIRGVWAPNDAAVVTDLEGFGASVSPQIGPVSTSVSFPYVEGVPQLDNPIFEAGYGTGPGGVSATLGYGIRVFGSDASLNDPANVGSGGTHCQCSQDFSFGDSYSGGASGGFVLYPSKPNLNQVQRVYAK
jgi:hypothetical protein